MLYPHKCEELTKPPFVNIQKRKKVLKGDTSEGL